MGRVVFVIFVIGNSRDRDAVIRLTPTRPDRIAARALAINTGIAFANAGAVVLRAREHSGGIDGIRGERIKQKRLQSIIFITRPRGSIIGTDEKTTVGSKHERWGAGRAERCGVHISVDVWHQAGLPRGQLDVSV